MSDCRFCFEDFCFDAVSEIGLGEGCGFVVVRDAFCIEIEGFCVDRRGFCIVIDGFCDVRGELCIEIVGFCI